MFDRETRDNTIAISELGIIIKGNRNKIDCGYNCKGRKGLKVMYPSMIRIAKYWKAFM